MNVGSNGSLDIQIMQPSLCFPLWPMSGRLERSIILQEADTTRLHISGADTICVNDRDGRTDTRRAIQEITSSSCLRLVFAYASTTLGLVCSDRASKLHCSNIIVG